MSSPRKPTKDEIELFRQSVTGTRPLRRGDGAKLQEQRRKPPPVPVQRFNDEQQVLAEMSDGLYDPSEHETGEELLYARPGVQQRLLRKLRSGQLSINCVLDLHGLTVALAKEALLDFLQDCRQRQVRCVRIIHGKGYNSPGKQPVLKGKLDHWLRQRDEVLAFCSAPQVHGGTGAVHVLLRRQ